MTFEAWGTEAGRIEAKSDLSTGSCQQKQRAGEDVPAPAVLLAGAWRLVHGGCDRCDYGEFLQKITVQSPSISPRNLQQNFDRFYVPSNSGSSNKG